MPTSEELKQKITALESERSSLRKQWTDATAQLEAKLEATSKPFREADARLAQNIETTKDEMWKADMAERSMAWKGKVPTTPEEYKSWFIDAFNNPHRVTSETFTAGFYVPHMDYVSSPITSIPGVTIFRGTDYEGGHEKFYVAFKGSKIVGALYVQGSEHPGDYNAYARGTVGTAVHLKTQRDEWSPAAQNYPESPMKTWLAELAVKV